MRLRIEVEDAGVKVYIVRHGQTDWNRDARWQGNRDIPLNLAGIEQAEKVSEKLLNLNISRIYSSSLIRSAETARVIQQKIDTEIIFCDDLREIGIGEWEGLTLSQMEEKYGELYREWDMNEAAKVGYGVENYQDLQNRAFAALKEICSKEDNPILVVAHGTWLRALMCKLLHIPLRCRNSFEIGNAGINILDCDKDNHAFKIITLNALL